MHTTTEVEEAVDRLLSGITYTGGPGGLLPTFMQRLSNGGGLLPSTPTFGCMICGAAVANPPHHMRWHVATDTFVIGDA